MYMIYVYDICILYMYMIYRIGWFIYTPNIVNNDYPHWCCERTNKTKQ